MCCIVITMSKLFILLMWDRLTCVELFYSCAMTDACYSIYVIVYYVVHSYLCWLFLYLNGFTSKDLWNVKYKWIKSKLNKLCYAIRSVKQFISLEIVRLTYCFCVHSIPSYGIIFWENSSYDKGIFKVQKRIITVITTFGRRDSCSELFRQLNILPLQSECILSLHLFIIKSRDQFLSNSEVQDINTRYNSNLHLPSENLTLYHKGDFFM